jgi:hypothetical protein
MQHAHVTVAKFHHIAIAQRYIWKLHLRRLMQIDRRVGGGGKLRRARQVIRLNVGLEDRNNRRCRLLCDGKIIFKVFDVGIDNSKFCCPCAAKDLRCTAGLRMENLPENHPELLVDVI